MHAMLLSLLLLAGQAPHGHGPPVVRGPPVVTPSDQSRSAVHAYALRPNRGPPLLQVRGADGAPAQVWQGQQRIMAETLPISLRVAPEMFYTVQVQLTPELSFEKKVLVHDGMIGVLEVWRPTDCAAAPPPPRDPPRSDGPPPFAGPPPYPPTQQPTGPVSMADGQFEALVRAMRAEPHEDRKLAVLQTAAQRNFFSIGQVGALVDLFAFGDGRVGAVRAVRGRIVDPENSFVLYEHFRFESEKEQVRRLLESR